MNQDIFVERSKIRQENYEEAGCKNAVSCEKGRLTKDKIHRLPKLSRADVVACGKDLALLYVGYKVAGGVLKFIGRTLFHRQKAKSSTDLHQRRHAFRIEGEAAGRTPEQEPGRSALLPVVKEAGGDDATLRLRSSRAALAGDDGGGGGGSAKLVYPWRDGGKQNSSASAATPLGSAADAPKLPDDYRPVASALFPCTVEAFYGLVFHDQRRDAFMDMHRQIDKHYDLELTEWVPTAEAAAPAPAEVRKDPSLSKGGKSSTRSGAEAEAKAAALPPSNGLPRNSQPDNEADGVTNTSTCSPTCMQQSIEVDTSCRVVNLNPAAVFSGPEGPIDEFFRAPSQRPQSLYNGENGKRSEESVAACGEAESSLSRADSRQRDGSGMDSEQTKPGSGTAPASAGAVRKALDTWRTWHADRVSVFELFDKKEPLNARAGARGASAAAPPPRAGDGFSRLLSFVKPKKPPSMMDTRCVQQQQMCVYDDGVLVLGTVQRLLDIPYCDCFTVNTIWVCAPFNSAAAELSAKGASAAERTAGRTEDLRQCAARGWDPAACCQVSVSLKVDFQKKVIFGVGPIISAAAARESAAFYQAFLAGIARRVTPPLPPPGLGSAETPTATTSSLSAAPPAMQKGPGLGFGSAPPRPSGGADGEGATNVNLPRTGQKTWTPLGFCSFFSSLWNGNDATVVLEPTASVTDASTAGGVTCVTCGKSCLPRAISLPPPREGNGRWEGLRQRLVLGLCSLLLASWASRLLTSPFAAALSGPLRRIFGHDHARTPHQRRPKEGADGHSYAVTVKNIDSNRDVGADDLWRRRRRGRRFSCAREHDSGDSGRSRHPRKPVKAQDGDGATAVSSPVGPVLSLRPLSLNFVALRGSLPRRSEARALLLAFALLVVTLILLAVGQWRLYGQLELLRHNRHELA